MPRADGRRGDTTRAAPSASRSVRPAQPRAGRPLTVLLVDRWKLGGVKSHACARGPLGRKRCRTLALHEHRKRAAWRFRPGLPGNWRIQVRTPHSPPKRDTAHVRPANGHLSLLATGDSMVQIIDGFLAQRLESDRVGVHSDARISTGISKPFLLNWPFHAREQASHVHPDVTVVFIGANDGFPLRTSSGHRVNCCGNAWISAYAKRASGMMASYARRGAGSVYWATLPAPRSASFRRVYRAVNHALRRRGPPAPRRGPPRPARQSLHARLPVPPIHQLARPLVSVRQPDGVHLNVTGASIAATLIIQAMRRDGVI